MKTAQLANLVVAATLTGNEFCTWAFVHRATKRLPMEHELAVEKRLTQLFIAPMAAWMSATVGTGIWAASGSGPRARPYLWAGTGAYAAMVAVTLLGNMPLNAATLRATTSMDDALWTETRRRWDRFHTARNILNGAGLTLLGVAAART
jgi:Domain of unknown function (DUF1772)